MMRMKNSWLTRRIRILLRGRPIRSPERLFFERVVIPALGRYGVRSVLFAGVAPYTWHYDRLCRRFGMTLHTIDRRPEAATWGAQGRHVVGDLEQVPELFPGQSFDLVVLMGVIGYGVNDESQAATVLKGVARLAARGGVVLVACEDRFGLDPVAIAAARHVKLVHQSCFCFPASVRLPNFDYGFHFFAAGGSA